jgi:hypothetical protein
MSLRPSALPKLAQCACYESKPDAGPAAARGSALDAVFRAQMQNEPAQTDMFYAPTEADLEAVAWAVTLLRTLAGGDPVFTREEDCRVKMLHMEGTADAIIPARLAHADLKTGQKRNYREQMAAYALGLMEKHFASEWTAHLLFCDQREVVTLRFTFEEARSLVRQVVARYEDPQKQPTVCDYCSWCVKADTCPARLAIVSTALAATKPDFELELVLSDNEKLGRFLTACSLLDDFREKAETLAKQRLKAGETIPGWKLVTRRGPEFVQHDEVARHITDLGFGPVLAAYGNLSAKKFRDVWEQKSNRPFPEEIIKHGTASLSLRATSTASATVSSPSPTHV